MCFHKDGHTVRLWLYDSNAKEMNNEIFFLKFCLMISHLVTLLESSHSGSHSESWNDGNHSTLRNNKCIPLVIYKNETNNILFLSNFCLPNSSNVETVIQIFLCNLSHSHSMNNCIVRG